MESPEIRAVRTWFASLEAIDTLRADLAATHPDWSPGAIDYVIANEVIAEALGVEWWVANLGSDKIRTPDYLRANPVDRMQKVEHVHRVVELARRMFELRGEPWFSRLVIALQSRDLAGASFEVEVIRMLLSLMLIAEPRVPTGERGASYDIDVRLAADVVWAIEVKTRDEEAPYRRNLISRTLERARSQLPPDGLGTVFLRIPEAWTLLGTYRREYPDEVIAFLRKTRRVHAVVFVWDEWRQSAFSGLQHQRRHRVFVSDRADTRIATILGFLDRIWDSNVDLVAPNAPF